MLPAVRQPVQARPQPLQADARRPASTTLQGRHCELNVHLPPAAPAGRTTALVLSGGLAIGAYHAGVYTALEAAGGPLPNWLAGCSIGAVTAAIIAGSRPEDRVLHLRQFWDAVSDLPAAAAWGGLPTPGPWQQALSWASATRTSVLGRPGLFHPRLAAADGPAPGLYDLAPLRDHLARTIDFARLNGGEVRVSIAATDVVTGERVIFDTGRNDRIGPEHLVASSALLPLFAPVEIGDRLLGDGGLVANTPLDLVLDEPPTGDLTIFASDLFAREGSHPRSLAAAAARAGDIVFGNQTHRLLETYRREHLLRAAVAELAGRLPERFENTPEIARLLAEGRARATTIFHLGYRAAGDVAGAQKAFSYAKPALAEHWRAGDRDLRAALQLFNATPQDGFSIHAVHA